jgi:hypothetical protein
VTVIKNAYKVFMGDDLQVFGVDKTNLNEFVTTESDVQKGTARIHSQIDKDPSLLQVDNSSMKLFENSQTLDFEESQRVKEYFKNT